jgi:hypothetical protein
LLQRSEPADVDEARRLLELALHDAHRLKLPEAKSIAQILAGTDER